MKVKKLRKLLNDTEYIISNRKDYIAVGSEYVHDLISVDKETLKIRYALDTYNEGRKALRHAELVRIWDKLQELINNGEIHDIINNNDEITNPLPVYFIDNGELIETFTEKYGWPNTTIDGTIMHDNVFYRTKKEAIEHGIRESEYYCEYKKESLADLKERVRYTEEEIINANNRLEHFKKLLENERNTDV